LLGKTIGAARPARSTSFGHALRRRLQELESTNAGSRRPPSRNEVTDPLPKNRRRPSRSGSPRRSSHADRRFNHPRIRSFPPRPGTLQGRPQWTISWTRRPGDDTLPRRAPRNPHEALARINVVSRYGRRTKFAVLLVRDVEGRAARLSAHSHPRRGRPAKYPFSHGKGSNHGQLSAWPPLRNEARRRRRGGSVPPRPDESAGTPPKRALGQEPVGRCHLGRPAQGSHSVDAVARGTS